MATTPNSDILPQKYITGSVVCTTAKANFGDTSNIQPLIAAGADGARINRITAIGRTSVPNTNLQLYRSKDSGVTVIFCDSALLPIITTGADKATTTATFTKYTFETPLILAGGESLHVAIGQNVASGVAFHAEGEALS